MVWEVAGLGRPLNFSMHDVSLLRKRWSDNATLGLLRFQPGVVGMLSAAAPYFAQYNEVWKRRETGGGYHNGAISLEPVKRYVLNQRRFMPWQISIPFLQSVPPQHAAALSVSFLRPEGDMMDLTLNNGFCPSFMKKSVSCAVTHRASLTGDRIHSCHSSREFINCCNDAAERNIEGPTRSIMKPNYG